MIDPIAIISLVLEVFSVLLQVIYHVINSVLKNLVPAYASEKSVEGETILITGAKCIKTLTSDAGSQYRCGRVGRGS